MQIKESVEPINLSQLPFCSPDTFISTNLAQILLTPGCIQSWELIFQVLDQSIFFFQQVQIKIKCSKIMNKTSKATDSTLHHKSTPHTAIYMVQITRKLLLSDWSNNLVILSPRHTQQSFWEERGIFCLRTTEFQPGLLNRGERCNVRVIQNLGSTVLSSTRMDCSSQKHTDNEKMTHCRHWLRAHSSGPSLRSGFVVSAHRAAGEKESKRENMIFNLTTSVWLV